MAIDFPLKEGQPEYKKQHEKLTAEPRIASEATDILGAPYGNLSPSATAGKGGGPAPKQLPAASAGAAGAGGGAK